MNAKNKKMRINSFNIDGFSLPELLVTITLGSIIAAGLGTLFLNISTVQSQLSTQAAIAQVAARLNSALSDSKAWANTLAIASPTAGGTNHSIYCMTLTTPTCVPTDPTPDILSIPTVLTNIQDGGPGVGSPLYTDNGINGFTYQGGSCVGFSTSTPNDNCPFSYRLRVQYSCPLATSCLVPEVTIWGILQFAPAASNTAYRSMNLSKFQIHVIKGVGTPRNDVVQITEQTNPSVVPAPVPTGAACTPGGVARKFTTKVTDSACSPIAGSCNVLAITPQVQLKAGTYVCSASAEGYAIGSFNITVKVNGTTQNFSSPPAFASLSPPGPDTTTLPNFKISSAVDFTLDVIQNCTAVGTMPPWDLGYPLALGGSYGTNVYSSLSCTRLL